MRAASRLLVTRRLSAWARSFFTSASSSTVSELALLSRANLFFVGENLISELADRLARARQQIRLAIETFVAMATHATTFGEQVASEIQHFGALSYAIARMTLLATGFSVLFLKHGPQPEAVTAVSLGVVGCGAAVTPVTTRAAKFLRIMNLEDFAVWMADKSPGKAVRFFAWSIRRQIRGLYIERLSDSCVTDFAAIDDVVGADTDLMTED